MKKLLFWGPVLTASGYGEHARQLLRSVLKNCKEQFDVAVYSVRWGETPFIQDEEISALCRKHDANVNLGEDYDVSIQVTIPNEFKRMAPVSIGVTAGIEVDRVAPLWIKKANENIDLLVVPSRHSAEAFAVVYTLQNGEQLKLEVPLAIVPEGFELEHFNDSSKDELDIKFETKFNFLSVGLGFDKAMGEDRKNISDLVKVFCETFSGNKEVGLILKTSLVNNSLMDFNSMKNRIQQVKSMVGCGEYPKIHLVHGRLTRKQLASLYSKADAYVTLTHGEGFGLPILEAAAMGIPVMATNWSGHLDFLKLPDGKKLFIPVEFDLKEIPESQVWANVIEKGTNWAVFKQDETKILLKKLSMSIDKPKEWASELRQHVVKNFNEEITGKNFCEMLVNFSSKFAQSKQYEELDYTPKIAGYTHLLNAVDQGYPFVESIKSMLGFCDEVVVVDGGSTDSTVEKIKEIGDDRIKLFVNPWSWDIPGMDGVQKQFARSKCSVSQKDFLWQMDADEIVHEEDYEKIKNLAKRFPRNSNLLHLPVIDLWGSEDQVRTDRHTWKWRLSRNLPEIIHGINKYARVVDDKSGKVYAKKNMSDGCEFIHSDTLEFYKHEGFYTREMEVARRTNPKKFAELSNEAFKQLPSVFHYSWVNIPRKIKTFKKFWNKQWSNLYNDQEPVDFFPDVATDEEILDKAIKLRDGEPHKLIGRGGSSGPIENFKLERSTPALMKSWVEESNKSYEK